MKYLGASANKDVRVRLAGTTYTLDDERPDPGRRRMLPVAGDATKVTCLAPKLSGMPQAVQHPPDGRRRHRRNLTNAPMYAYGSAGNDQLLGSANAADGVMGAKGRDTGRDTGGENVLDGG